MEYNDASSSSSSSSSRATKGIHTSSRANLRSDHHRGVGRTRRLFRRACTRRGRGREKPMPRERRECLFQVHFFSSQKKKVKKMSKKFRNNRWTRWTLVILRSVPFSFSLRYKKRMRVKVALREATYKSIRLVHASTSNRHASCRRRRSPGRGSRRWRPGGWRSTRRRLGRWHTRRRSRRWRSTQSRHGGSRCRGASQNASRASNATALRRRDGLLVRGNDGFLRVFSFGNSRGGVSRNFSRSVSAPKLDGVVVASRDKQVTGWMPSDVVGLAFVGTANFRVWIGTSANNPVSYGTIRSTGGKNALVVRMPRD